MNSNQTEPHSNNLKPNLLRDRPFVGGFFLTKEDLDSVVDFSPFPLQSGWTLWHDARGHLQAVELSEKFQIVVFGNFYHLDEPDTPKVLHRLAAAYEIGKIEFEKETDLLVGRYVLIFIDGPNCYVSNDALGTRSIYYSTKRSAISSHYNLIAKDTAAKPVRAWNEARMAMDLTLSSDIQQLLPNFRLNCSNLQVDRYFPSRSNEFVNWSHEEKQAEITRLWKRSVESLLSQEKNVVFSITGGLDSRLSVSMAHAHWDQLTLFTYGSKEAKDSNYSKVMNRDYQISQNIIEVIRPKEYKFLHLAENKRIDSSLASLLRSNSITKHGAGLVQRYRQEFPGDDWIHVRSTGIEVARNYFGPNQSLDSIVRLCEQDGAIDFHDRIGELGFESEQFGYNKKDLIYWELRMGKWHSEVLNENDAAFDTILPHNSRRLLKLLLSYPLPQRQTSFALKELINTNSPLLNFFGINDPRNLYEIIRDEQFTNTKPVEEPKKPLSTKEILLETTKVVSNRGILGVKRRLGNFRSSILRTFK